MPSTQDFEKELDSIFKQAEQLPLCFIGIKSKDLHKKLNPNNNKVNEYPKCCNAMKNKKINSEDRIIQNTPSFQSPNLIIQYKIPRK